MVLCSHLAIFSGVKSQWFVDTTNRQRIISRCDRARFWVGTLELQWALARIKFNHTSLSLAHIGLAREVQLVGTRLS